MKTKVVKLSSFFDRSISTRVAIENLFSFDNKGTNEIVLDFKNIYFISSSASHQLIIEAGELEKKGITVSFKNIENNIDRMLELSKTDRKNIFTVQNIEHLKVRSDKELNRLLLSL